MLAPRARFELATLRLTAECSTVELPGNWLAISSNCNKLRRVLFIQDDIGLGHTGHNKAKSDSFDPVASVLDILFELFRIFVRNVLVRMTYPELLQVERRMWRAEVGLSLEPHECQIAGDRVPNVARKLR